MTKVEKNAERLAEVVALKKALEAEEKSLKAEIMSDMSKGGKKHLDTDHISITYIEATTKTTFDSKKFEQVHPKMYKDFLKTSSVSESLRVSLNA